MNEPQRRTQRRKHLDASAIPIEEALLHRALILEVRAKRTAWDATHPELGIHPEEAQILQVMATEFRALAEELHWR